MIGRTTRRTWFDTLKSKYFEIEFIDERLNDSDRIILADIVIETFGEQCALGSASPSTKRFMDLPYRLYVRSVYHHFTFLHSLGHERTMKSSNYRPSGEAKLPFRRARNAKAFSCSWDWRQFSCSDPGGQEMPTTITRSLPFALSREFVERSKALFHAFHKNVGCLSIPRFAVRLIDGKIETRPQRKETHHADQYS